MKQFLRSLIRWTVLIGAIQVIVIFALVSMKYYANANDHELVSKYDTLLNYSAGVDYQVPMGFGQQIIIPIIDNQIQWPEVTQFWTMALLSLDIATDKSAVLTEPLITLHYKAGTISHCFEHGTQGIRVLNLSPLQGKIQAGEIVGIDLTDAKLSSTEATLTLYNSGPDLSRILVIAPHPDDAEIAAAGLYQHYSDNCWVVTITSGDGGGNRFNNLFNNKDYAYWRKAELRTLDSLFAPKALGIPQERIANLGYFDQTLAELYNSHSVVSAKKIPNLNVNLLRNNPIYEFKAVSTWASLVADLSILIQVVQPTVIVTPHPELDTHSDHQFSTFAVIAALRETPDVQPDFLLYTNHSGTELFPLGRYEDEITIPFIRNQVFVDGLFSYQLTAEERSNKLLAIDMMHDLKRLPKFSSKNSLGDFMRSVKDSWHDQFEIDKGYIRRAARPNELFCVVNYENIGRISLPDITLAGKSQ